MAARSGSPRSPPLAESGRSSIESSRPVRARKFPRLCRLIARCARRRFVVAIAPARRPCPLPPPPRPPSPPLPAVAVRRGVVCPLSFPAPLRSGGGAWLRAAAPPRAIPRASVPQGRPAPPPSLRCAIPPRFGRSSVGRNAPTLLPLTRGITPTQISLFFLQFRKSVYLCSRILTPKTTKKWLKFMVFSAP